MQSGIPSGTDAKVPVAKSGFAPLDTPGTPSPLPLQQPVASIDVPADSLAEIVPQPVADVILPDHVVLASLDEAGDSSPQLPVLQAQPELVCDVEAEAVIEGGAMVRLGVSAACLPNERVVVHHNGMMFSELTDAEGRLDVLIPALSENAVFIVEFANGEGAVATVDVSSLSFYDRVVLQWAGDIGFHVHAREFGADYDSEGHVWTGSARDMSAAARGEGGFVTALGRADGPAPLLAEVYTYPTAAATQAGLIDLTVEAEVTAANCGREVEAQSLELQAEGRLRTRDLALTMPGCDAAGDFLVLNNLMDDLKIAAR